MENGNTDTSKLIRLFVLATHPAAGEVVLDQLFSDLPSLLAKGPTEQLPKSVRGFATARNRSIDRYIKHAWAVGLLINNHVRVPLSFIALSKNLGFWSCENNEELS